jgi:hypothetical protein
MPTVLPALKGATMTFARLEQESDAFAVALASLGVKRGDRIGLLLPNCPTVSRRACLARGSSAPSSRLSIRSTPSRELEGPIVNEGIEDQSSRLTRFYPRLVEACPSRATKAPADHRDEHLETTSRPPSFESCSRCFVKHAMGDSRAELPPAIPYDMARCGGQTNLGSTATAWFQFGMNDPRCCF